MTPHIYGIYHRGVCVYVGVTIHPRKRLEQHRNPTRGKMRDLKRIRMRIFRTSDFENASRIENQIIRAFKRRGQAVRNTISAHRQGFACLASQTSIKCKKTGKIYLSYADAARDHGMTYGTFMNWFKSCGGKRGGPLVLL